MASVQLTHHQQQVVDHTGGALLVSAAAGSGKTKVLVDRLMRQICRPENPCHITDFLVITYTKAAAGELRHKIAQELSARLLEDRDNRHLSRQLRLIHGAEISTIHGFCGNILRKYGHVIGLSSDFRVAEELESKTLRTKLLGQVLEQSYLPEYATPAVEALRSGLGFGRDDRGMASAVEKVLDSANCHLYPDQWMADCQEALNMDGVGDCGQTIWGRYLLGQLAQECSAMREPLSDAMFEVQGDDLLSTNYLPAFLALDDKLKALMECATWQEAQDALTLELPGIKAVRKYPDKVFLDAIKGVRAEILDSLKGWNVIFFRPNEDTLADLVQANQGLLGALELASRLQNAFQREKRRLKLVDFGDLEHLAVKLLLEPGTTCPTSIAREISRQYTEVMMDEYQDSNGVQDAIFRAISQQGANRFMVGDVKQSIYRFRLADPTIFLKKYKKYEISDENAPVEPRKILLSENFRSRPEILAGANHVFAMTMSEQVGDLTYGEEEALRNGREFGPMEGPAVELHVMGPVLDEQGKELASKVETEAAFVAGRIATMVEEGTPPQDIVILMRSLGSTADPYLKALQQRGIPAVCDRGRGILDAPEVETVMALLQVLDNPHQDIPLAAAMCSPLFGFTADEMALLRSGHKDLDLYDTLQSSEAPKVGQFLTQISNLRQSGRWQTLAQLLGQVYQATGAQDIYGVTGQVDNLHQLAEYATEFSQGGTRGLHQFCNHIAGLKQAKSNIPARPKGGDGAVTILSIHKSKGLEFPVVFLADLSRGFNKDDMKQSVLSHPQLFLGSNLLDKETAVRYPTLAKQAIARKVSQENLSEEMRVLYVAMTRPVNRLIMTYCSKYLEKDIATAIQKATVPTLPYVSAQAKCLGSWVLLAAAVRQEATALRDFAGITGQVTHFDHPWQIEYHPTVSVLRGAGQTAKGESLRLTPPSQADLAQVLDFQYPYSNAVQLPAKVTPTQLKGRELDREVEAKSEPYLRRPAFLVERKGLSASAKGTANHLFLQFATYENCQTLEGVAGEVERLVDQAFFTEQQGQAVIQPAMVALFTSTMGQSILSCPHVEREFKFSLAVPAQDLGLGDTQELVMLQGVADCILVEPDGLTVMDFKSDRVTEETVGQRVEHYRQQLVTYDLALTRMFQAPVKGRYLYFLQLNRWIGV